MGVIDISDQLTRDRGRRGRAGTGDGGDGPTTPSFAALLAHHRRLCRMFADPNCVGELLLVGVGMARVLDLEDPFPISETTSLKDFRIPVYGPMRFYSDLLMPAGDQFYQRSYADSGWGRVASVIRHDIPRYVPPNRRHAHNCGRPRVRTEGTCGRTATNHVYLTDPATGVKQPVGACSQNSCKKWLNEVAARNRKTCVAAPPPRPPFNAGGVLERHLPELDWWALYKTFDPGWVAMTEPHEKPRLRLVVSAEDLHEAQNAAAPTPGGRAKLTVVEGGWPELVKIGRGEDA